MVSKIAAKLIEQQPKEFNRGDEAENLKQSIISVEDTLTFEMENDEYIIAEECRDLIRQVQLAKEKRIEEINEHSDVLIRKTGAFQEKCLSKYHQMKEPKKKIEELANNVYSLNQQQKAYLKQRDITDKETIALHQQLQEMKAKVEKKRELLKRKMFIN